MCVAPLTCLLLTAEWSFYYITDLAITNTGTVEVSHAAPEHSGSYRCTLRNFVGEAHIDYEVEVLSEYKTYTYLLK